jgi:thiamine-phosphate pyrophosphorylase
VRVDDLFDDIAELANNAAQLRARAGAPVAADGSALPALILVTDARRLVDPLAAVRVLPRGSAVLLRDYEHPDRATLANALAGACAAQGVALWIGADVALARRIGAGGLHLRERDLAGADRPAWSGVLTASVHDGAGLTRAHAWHADAALLAPVFATESHPDAVPLGIARTTALVRAARLPVYALGGIDARNAAQLLESGVAGIAAIGAFAAPRSGPQKN